MATKVKALEIIEIRDEGTENERLLLRATSATKLDNFVVINAKSGTGNKITLLNQYVYWFQDGITVNGGEIVRLYTRKSGTYTAQITNYGDEKVRFHNFYWGLPKSIWNKTSSDTVVVLYIETWATMTKR